MFREDITHASLLTIESFKMWVDDRWLDYQKTFVKASAGNNRSHRPIWENQYELWAYDRQPNGVTDEVAQIDFATTILGHNVTPDPLPWQRITSNRIPSFPTLHLHLRLFTC